MDRGAPTGEGGVMLEKRTLGGLSVVVNSAPDSRARLRRIFEILMRAHKVNDGKREGPLAAAGLPAQRHRGVTKCQGTNSIIE